MATGGGEGETQRILRLSDIAKEPLEMLMPIGGYERMPIVSLEIAVEPLVSFLPSIQSYVYTAKKRCKNPPADDLTIDESASIMLYSMEWKPRDTCLYVALNATLRSEDRDELEPWFLYLKLFLTALSRLPSIPRHVYRGVKLELSAQYQQGKTIVWWGFSSCTTSVRVLQSESFLGKTGTRTMFNIDCDSGKDIQNHSYYRSEDEVLLLAATEFKVIGYLDQGNGLHIIQLKETKPPFPLLHPVLPFSNSNKSISNIKTKKKSEENESSIELKTNNTKDDQNDKTTIITNTTVKSEDQEFARPGKYKELDCKGRCCAKCGKCRDSYYTGDLETWHWIQNYTNWGESDWQRWINIDHWNHFKTRDGATCDYFPYLHAGYFSDPPPYDFPLRPDRLFPPPDLFCLCDDNVCN